MNIFVITEAHFGTTGYASLLLSWTLLLHFSGGRNRPGPLAPEGWVCSPWSWAVCAAGLPTAKLESVEEARHGPEFQEVRGKAAPVLVVPG